MLTIESSDGLRRAVTPPPWTRRSTVPRAVRRERAAVSAERFRYRLDVLRSAVDQRRLGVMHAEIVTLDGGGYNVQITVILGHGQRECLFDNAATPANSREQAGTLFRRETARALDWLESQLDIATFHTLPLVA